MNKLNPLYKHWYERGSSPLAPVLFRSVTRTPNNTHYPQCSNDKAILFAANIFLTLVGLAHPSASKIPHNRTFDICYVLADKIGSQEYFGFARIKQYTYIVSNIYAKLRHILKSLTAVLQKIPEIEIVSFSIRREFY
jgi:hypothetical protein